MVRAKWHQLDWNPRCHSKGPLLESHRLGISRFVDTIVASTTRRKLQQRSLILVASAFGAAQSCLKLSIGKVGLFYRSIFRSSRLTPTFVNINCFSKASDSIRRSAVGSCLSLPCILRRHKSAVRSCASVLSATATIASWPQQVRRFPMFAVVFTPSAVWFSSL